MEIIDSHAHIYPRMIAEKAVDSIKDFYTIDMDCDGTVEGLITTGKEAGVDRFIVQSVAVDGRHVQSINNFIAKECDAHDCLYGFGTMHADFDNKIDELERMRGLGLKGIKLHPDTQRFNMDDERMDEVYDYARGCGMPVLIHCGDYRYDYSHPRRLVNILHKFPGVKVMAAHFGGWSIFDLALEYLADEDCYLDTSSSIAFIGVNRAKELIRLYGADRILFGTDYPMWKACDELRYFKQMDLTTDELEKLFHKNAEGILGL